MTNSNIDIDKAGWSFDNTYTKLPADFFVKQNPIPVKSPELIILNKNLSKDLNLDFTNIREENLSQLFSGNLLPVGSNSIAQAYAGHQFGHFTMLGDGRAVLIGEHLTENNERFDIQFKGSGRTPFSRSGDGRAALGPMLREYIISEAMYSLKIPTTRSLAVVKTGEDVIREQISKGAILTRVALGHLRVGTFQYIAAKQNISDLEILISYTIEKHYPNIKSSKNKALGLLYVLIEKQTQLVIDWMRVGFIHGVMNTDNMSISGETIDYGPCAFMDTYDPKTVFSSIDQLGRYAYDNQPKITKWNLTRFAECLIPLISKNKDEAIKLATEALDKFEKNYEKKWLNMMRDKLGLYGEDKEDKNLIVELLNWMQKNKIDYTNTFIFLMNKKIKKPETYNNADFDLWKIKWVKRLTMFAGSHDKSMQLMNSSNPMVIPRNHKVEEALILANNGDLSMFNKLIEILKKPYLVDNDNVEFMSPPLQNDKKYQTFCGT
ncbi:YdiU family protein [Candidatus Pelagibacter sp.]|nr:YdiU family protein [Candidatus Pelagibacter sp.]